MYKIIETDNFGRDYPVEHELNLPPMSEEHAKLVANAINDGFSEYSERYWKVEHSSYIPEKGFEP